MYYNDYSLRQLLELALRVPEVGAVNFNILYYILKSIIQKQGLENVKPVFSFEAPLTAQCTGAKVKLKDASHYRSYSAESLRTINGNTLKDTKKDEAESDETSKARSRKHVETESNKWHTIKVFKRIDAVEDEISEIHIMIAQLIDKISNLERATGLQETKYLKNITELQHKLESSEDKQLAAKLEKISSDVAVLMSNEKNGDTKSDKEDENTDLNAAIPIRSTVSDSMAKKVEETAKDPTDHKKKVSDPDIRIKIDTLFNDMNEIKKQLKVEPKFTEPENVAFDPSKNRKDTGKVEEEPYVSKRDIEKIDLELLNTFMELRKLQEKCATIDKMLNSDLNKVKEKNLILERTAVKYEIEINLLKASWDEMVHNFESLKETMEFIQKEINILSDLPGLINRIEQLEGYVFSGYDYECTEETGKMLHPSERRTKLELYSRTATASDKKIPKAKVTTAVTGDKAYMGVIQPTMGKMKKAKAQDIEKYLDEGSKSIERERRRFQVIARDVALVQDMAKKRVIPTLKTDQTCRKYTEDDDLYEEPIYESEEKPSAAEFEKVSNSVSPHQVYGEYSGGRIKTSTFGSPDILDEHSRQLKGQVIVYVNKRLQAFEVDLQHIEGDLVTVKKKNDLLEKNLKELAIKVAVAEANFSQKSGDLAALKGMAENHQVSIVNIIHHLDRKAEAYTVNQKVSRKELTVIEDRILKLCVTASSEISKLEEKLCDSAEKFNTELDKKLFKEEFQVHFESLLHKLKVLDFKTKNVLVQNPALDFETIRPVEVKKYIVSTDGTKVKQERRKITSWKSYYETDSLIPILTQHADKEASPKTGLRVQKEYV